MGNTYNEFSKKLDSYLVFVKVDGFKSIRLVAGIVFHK